MNAALSQIMSTRPGSEGAPPLRPAEGAQMVRGRAHEVCGASRHRFALMAAAAALGPVFWIAPLWSRLWINAAGFADWLDPGRLVFVSAPKVEDMLWVAEEVLRSGVAPLVVADLPAPPALTPVRRLHLAAEAGTRNAGAGPMALLLTPEGAAAGVESRWALHPESHAGGLAFRVERLRARGDPPASWGIDGAGHARAPASVH